MLDWISFTKQNWTDWYWDARNDYVCHSLEAYCRSV